MSRYSSRGLTLIETIIAGGLALVLGLLMVKLLMSGLGAHKKGSQSRDAQSGVRNLLGLFVSELRSAAPPPLAEPGVVTPVFWPGVWGAAQEQASPTNLYLRNTVASSVAGIELDQASNRLVYVRETEQAFPGATGPLAQYALVELFVPQDRPHQLERRVHPLSSIDSLLVRGSVTGADGAQRSGWLLDWDAVDALEPSPTPDVLYDSGTDSRLAFRVSHRSFQPTADPGRTRYPQNFDPAVFKIEVAVAIGNDSAPLEPLDWPLKQNWDTLRVETTELRIPSVRQN